MKQQEVDGKVKKVQGKIKESVGILTGNKKMEREGSVQRATGAVEEGLAKAGRKVGEALTNLGNAIKK
ncbi:MAG: CsbD family protein [Acidobacteriota bacterium]